MKDIVVKGAIFKEGEMKNGLYSILKEKFIDSPSNADVEGTLIKAPINFHTHVVVSKNVGFRKLILSLSIKSLLDAMNFSIYTSGISFIPETILSLKSMRCGDV